MSERVNELMGVYEFVHYIILYLVSMIISLELTPYDNIALNLRLSHVI